MIIVYVQAICFTLSMFFFIFVIASYIRFRSAIFCEEKELKRNERTESYKCWLKECEQYAANTRRENYLYGYDLFNNRGRK